VADDKLCHRVIIEASNSDEAIDIAENLGVYFDGCDSGYDCECCGDRWYRPWDGDGKTFPYSYGTFTKENAEHLVETYKGKTEPAEKKFLDRDTNFIFETIESYAQYMADEYGWTTPDVRIFYKNGEVKEIFIKKK
jgi:hypothetical protein